MDLTPESVTPLGVLLDTIDSKKIPMSDAASLIALMLDMGAAWSEDTYARAVRLGYAAPAARRGVKRSQQ